MASYQCPAIFIADERYAFARQDYYHEAGLYRVKSGHAHQYHTGSAVAGADIDCRFRSEISILARREHC